MMPAWQPLLDFWFGELRDGQADARHRRQWFTVDAAFDAECIGQFASWLEPGSLEQARSWLITPPGCLAYIILTDQIPRNIHRGKAEAFSWDQSARSAALHGIRKGMDLTLGWDERAFFYMPFEHSEQLLDQHLAVGLFTALRDAAPKQLRSITGNHLRHAQQHRDIILQFSRFPHRNSVLDRISTTQESTFIANSDGFGQSPESVGL